MKLIWVHVKPFKREFHVAYLWGRIGDAKCSSAAEVIISTWGESSNNNSRSIINRLVVHSRVQGWLHELATRNHRPDHWYEKKIRLNAINVKAHLPKVISAEISVEFSSACSIRRGEGGWHRLCGRQRSLFMVLINNLRTINLTM